MNRFNSIIILVIIVFLGCSNPASTPANPFVDYRCNIIVNRVIDGDTFTWLINNEEYSIRILGIDCFETKHNDRLIGQAAKAGISEDSAYTLGQIAKAFADSLLTGKLVTLTRDSAESNFDTYNRLLRHVFIGGKSYSDVIIAKGLSVN